MSDTQARLIEILRRRGAYCGDCDFESGGCEACAKVLGGYADAILAEFLVIPRSEITGTEYGWRHWLDDGQECVHPATSRDHAFAGARMDSVFSSSDALERPALPPLPWSVIPFPEGGQS